MIEVVSVVLVSYLPYDDEHADRYDSHVRAVGVQPAHVGPALRRELQNSAPELTCGRVDISAKRNMKYLLYSYPWENDNITVVSIINQGLTFPGPYPPRFFCRTRARFHKAP